MKKQLIIVGILVILIVVGLSGCTQDSTNDLSNNNTNDTNNTEILDDESRFIGMWRIDLEGNASGYARSYECIKEEWTFFINGTLVIRTTYEEGFGTGRSRSNWYLENGRFHTIANYNLAYEFTNDDTHLVMSGTIWSGASTTFILDKIL